MAKRAAQAAAVVSADWAHSFERAGLGKAPFFCRGYSVEKFQAAPGAPIQCGTSCDYCSTAIMRVFRIESSDGHIFKVGCDCVARTGDTELIEAARREQRRQEWAWRNADHAAYAEAHGKVRAAQKAAMAERNAVEMAWVIEGASVVAESQNSGEWDRKVAQTVYRELVTGERDGITDREWRVLSLGYLAAMLPASKHVAADGERLRGVVARYEGGPTVGIDSKWGPSVLARLRVTEGPMAGAVLIWKTGCHPVKIGAVVSLTGTVKGHGEYAGTAQTFVTRCKVTVVEESPLAEEDGRGF